MIDKMNGQLDLGTGYVADIRLVASSVIRSHPLSRICVATSTPTHAKR